MLPLHRLAAAALVALAPAAPAFAADLRIGVAAQPTSLDPHFHNNGANNALARHVFDTLALQNAEQQISPGLAKSWRLIDDVTWEFALRPGVTFHDGTPFTAADVAFTLERAPAVPNSPSTFGAYTKQIAGVTIVDPHTIRLTTAGPAPLLAIDLSGLAIISRKAGLDATTADYQSGRAMVGTGPYKLAQNLPGDRVIYTRNPDYWGGQEPWERVTYRFIANGPSRVAALLAGDVEVIDEVPSTDVTHLRKRQDLKLWSGVTNRMTFLSVDVHNEVSMGANATDNAGNPLPKNPMRDIRVRQALSLAIDRDVLVDRVNEGEAIRADQLVPKQFFGFNPEIKPESPDPALARKLLAEAGYPEGFKIILHTSNDRIANATRTVQVIAAMWTRIGIKTTVETMPHTVYSNRTARNELSHMLHSWGAGTGEAAGTFVGIVHTRGGNYGGSNRGRYSDPQVDAAIKLALATVDDDKRRKILQDTMVKVVADKAIIPLVFWVSTWGTLPAFTYVPQASQATLAMAVRAAR